MEISPALQEVIDSLRQGIAALRLENAALRQENAGLRRRLGLDSSNSSKPPSSDGPAKKPRIAGSLRGASGKPGGGQAGHKGDTLKQVVAAGHIEAHAAEVCAHCQAALTAAMALGWRRRQVFDLPRPRLEVIEHRARTYRCARCQGVTRADFPEGAGAPAQYGPRMRAAAVYLNVQQLIPEDRTAAVLADLFGARTICPASIVAWGVRKAEDLAPFVAEVAARLNQAPVRHLDETGFRTGGKTQWLHTASTAELTHYRVSAKRGDVAAAFAGGVIVHDHFKPYYTLGGVSHALCNAHHLRELKALIEIEKEPWAKKMFRLLCRANAAVKRAVAQGAQALAPLALRRITGVYDAIVTRGLAFHQAQPALTRRAGARGRQARRPGHNLLIRLRHFKADVLRFANDLAVPFTNNQAEQDIRMMKVKAKISGGFRTQDGAETFATLRSVLSTARKRGWDILQTLAKPSHELAAALA